MSIPDPWILAEKPTRSCAVWTLDPIGVSNMNRIDLACRFYGLFAFWVFGFDYKGHFCNLWFWVHVFAVELSEILNIQTTFEYKYKNKQLAPFI